MKPNARKSHSALTIGDLVPNWQPRVETCCDCGSTFIAHAATFAVKRGAAEGDDDALASFYASCGCVDYGASDEP